MRRSGGGETDVVVEEVEEPLGGEASGHRLAVPGGSFGPGEVDELLLPREQVVQALGLATGSWATSDSRLRHAPFSSTAKHSGRLVGTCCTKVFLNRKSAELQGHTSQV